MLLPGGGRWAPVPPLWISSPLTMVRRLGKYELLCYYGSFPRGVFP
eukprot:COSAG01_NODE_406_length_17453_cov_83.218105_5_plen_46_part_00